MPPFPIIGLAGLAGAGKTTAAHWLEHERGYVRLPFAGPIKAMARAFGLNLREIAGDLKEAPCAALCGATPRQFMQLLGTEFGRQMLGPDIWVQAWLRAVDLAHHDAMIEQGDSAARALIVADDVRFPNEAAAIRRLGGVILRIERPGAGSASGAAHASEAGLGMPDCIIRNTGTAADLGESLGEALADMAARRGEGAAAG